MHITVDFPLFVDAFRNTGYENKFSYEALEALFNYLEEYEQDTGEEIELDVVGLCCEFAEYSNAIEAAADYGFTSELEEEALEWLQDRTEVINFDRGLIIQNF